MNRSGTVDGKTIPQAYLRRIKLTPDAPAQMIKVNGTYETITWKQVHKKVLGIFGYLQGLGLSRGDRICIVGNTCPQWTYADLAAQCAGLAAVPIYHSSHVDDVAFIIKHCGAKMVFAEDATQLEKLAQAFKINGASVPVVTFVHPAPKVAGVEAQSMEGMLNDPKAESYQGAFEKSAEAAKPEDLASIVYTSGTTGRPKGVMLSQSNFASELSAVCDLFQFTPEDRTLTFLPFAHIFGRVESYAPIYAGLTMAFAENINTVAPNLQEAKPTLLLSVPRIYEKVYAKIQSGVEAGSPAKKKLFHWAVGVGRQVARARSQKKGVSPLVMAQYLIADKLVFSKVRARMGGRIRFTVSGGAPLGAELCEFFHACGIKVLEGYGLTETSAAIAVNQIEDYAFGTVGKPFAGTEFRIASDGEILVRGPVVFKGYYNAPDATAEAIDKDGWFHTGDIGEFTDRGMLRITDRKKEIIVTSAGKNVAPQKIENLLKGIRFVSNAFVYGDKEKYLVALVTPNEDECKRWAQLNGVSAASMEQLVIENGLLTAVEAEIKSVNGSLASYETVKKFKIVPQDFTVETGELTPSLKLKRRVVTAKYETLIKQMYS